MVTAGLADGPRTRPRRWDEVVAMKMGRDFGIVAAAMIVAGLALVWAVPAALDLVDLAGETVRDRRDAL